MNVWIFTASLFLLATLSASRGEEDLTGTVRFKRSSAAQPSAGPQEVLFKFRVKRQFGFSNERRSNERYDSPERFVSRGRHVSPERFVSRGRHVSRERFVSRENSKEFGLASFIPALDDLSSSETDVLGIVVIKGIAIKILAAVFLAMQGLTNMMTTTSTET